ncbi:MAG: amino acid permease [Verrucomicrobiota bacterium]|nr:amino acid permease [Verrucomicrobiota bacterium]
MNLFLRKPIRSDAAKEVEGHQFKRHLGSFQLTAIGIGAIIGAGIFVITGKAASDYAGPAIIISFILAAIVCLFTGLCYAELSSLIPISGGSYTYSYVAMGEFPAWLMGWAVTAQCLISASTVAVGWSGYFKSILNDFGLSLPDSLSSSPIIYEAARGLEWSGSLINFPAIFLVGLVGILISIGIQAAARFNHAMVFIKLATILVFIAIGAFYIKPSNWSPFIPENTGIFGQFGISGIFRASGLVFFAYLGFDTVSTLAQEAIKPQRDLPRGILGSITISAIAYIATALVLTGMVSYTALGVPDPMAVALNSIGPHVFWLSFAIKLAILAGLSSVVLVQLLGQTRIFYAISKDGLLPSRFSSIHRATKSPLFSCVVTTLLAMLAAGLFPINVLGQLVSIMTLFIFTIVCLGVWILRKTHPEYKRPFRAPFVPLVPILGIVTCVGQMCFLPLSTWIQFILWMLLGLLTYFLYGYRHSKLRQ